eukprot:4186445-Prymnesium_polylepis.1
MCGRGPAMCGRGPAPRGSGAWHSGCGGCSNAGTRMAQSARVPVATLYLLAALGLGATALRGECRSVLVGEAKQRLRAVAHEGEHPSAHLSRRHELRRRRWGRRAHAAQGIGSGGGGEITSRG